MAARAKRTVLTILVVGALLVVGIVVLVILRQDALIYYPHRYSPAELEAAVGARILEYTTEEGRQVAFLVTPHAQADDVPRTLWVIFGGNASLALHWLEFARAFPDSHSVFLLFDYPGYGRCEGRPTPETIQRSAEAALERVLQTLDSKNLRIGVLGHSLGAAAALLLASHTRVDDLVLLAPFTSMTDMARRVVGSPLAQLLRHRFDNRARLREVLSRFPATRVSIVHGTEDEVIPVAMGRELSLLSPSRITYVELSGADHNGLPFTYAPESYRLMVASHQHQGSGSP